MRSFRFTLQLHCATLSHTVMAVVCDYCQHDDPVGRKTWPCCSCVATATQPHVSQPCIQKAPGSSATEQSSQQHALKQQLRALQRAAVMLCCIDAFAEHCRGPLLNAKHKCVLTSSTTQQHHPAPTTNYQRLAPRLHQVLLLFHLPQTHSCRLVVQLWLPQAPRAQPDTSCGVMGGGDGWGQAGAQVGRGQAAAPVSCAA